MFWWSYLLISIIIDFLLAKASQISAHLPHKYVYILAFVFSLLFARIIYFAKRRGISKVPSSGIYVRYSPRRSNSETWSWPLKRRREHWRVGGSTTVFRIGAGTISDDVFNRRSRTSIANIMLNLSWMGQCRYCALLSGS